MKSLTIFCKSIEVGLKTGPDICDITHQINKLARESNIENGQEELQKKQLEFDFN